MPNDWRIYEEAACHVISNLRQALGVHSVEGKQTLDGASGASWEVDAKAWCEDNGRILIVEVRRYTTSRLKQEDLAAIAYRIQDTGGAGGIVVSPLPLQQGARLVAASAGIEHVRLTSDSTPERYLAEYMGQRYHGVAIIEALSASVTLVASVLRAAPEGESQDTPPG